MPHPACQEAEGQALTLLGEWEVGVPTGSGRAGGAGVSLILTPPFFFNSPQVSYSLPHMLCTTLLYKCQEF